MLVCARMKEGNHREVEVTLERLQKYYVRDSIDGAASVLCEIKLGATGSLPIE